MKVFNRPKKNGNGCKTIYTREDINALKKLVYNVQQYMKNNMIDTLGECLNSIVLYFKIRCT